MQSCLLQRRRVDVEEHKLNECRRQRKVTERQTPPRTASLPASITVCSPECGMRARRVGACATTEAPPTRPSSRPSVGSVRLYERTLQLSQNRVFSNITTDLPFRPGACASSSSWAMSSKRYFEVLTCVCKLSARFIKDLKSYTIPRCGTWPRGRPSPAPGPCRQ